MSTSMNCKGCGAQVVIPDGQRSAKCEYCGIVNTLAADDSSKSNNADSLIRRAYILLGEGSFQKAATLVEQALNLEPENASAYIAQLMSAAGARQESDLAENSELLTRYTSYNNALEFGSSEQKQRLEEYNGQILKRLEKEREDALKAQRRRAEYESGQHRIRMKKAKKILAVIGIAAIVILVISVVASAYAVPQGKYEKAMAYAEQKDYDLAATGFADIMDYKDSREQLAAVAQKAYNAGDLSTAARAWRSLGDVEKMQLFHGRIAVGSSHYAGLNANGTVVAVGNDDFGQCDVSGWTDIQAISAGADFTVGLKYDRTVVAAGNNEDGQCDVSGWTDIVKVDAGANFTVGIKSDGTVLATGNNGNGQCDVSGWTDITDIAAGDCHTAGLKKDGTVLTTGSNIYDQCNVEGYDFSYNNIVAVEAGNRNTLGLKNYGQIVAAGSDVDTILLLDTRDKKIVAADSGDGFVSALYEDGTVESSSSRQDLDGNDFIAVTCGESVTLGLSADGKVVSSKEYYADEISKWNLLNDTPVPVESQPSPTPSPGNPAINGEEFAFLSDDVYAALHTDNDVVNFDDRQEYDYPDYTADWSPGGSLRLVCYNDPQTGAVQAITLVCGSSSLNSSHGDAFFEYFAQIMDLCNVTKSIDEISDDLGLFSFTRGPDAVSTSSDGVGIDFTWNDVDLFFVIYPETTSLDISSLPIKIDRQPDFFSDETRLETFNELNGRYRFTDIIALANEYIEQNAPAETDSAYAILEYAQTGAEALENCTVIEDEFEDAVSIYYDGVEKISSDINLLPYIEGHSFNTVVGFAASDWLFFTSVMIKADDEKIFSYYSNTAINQDVMDGGIREQVRIVLQQEDVDQIVDAGEVLMRFESDEGETRDHTLTENEISALSAIRTIQSSYAGLKGLAYSWEND